MARTGIAQRIVIIVMAAVFFITSIGLSVFVIIEAVQQNRDSKAAEKQSQEAASNPNSQKLANFTPTGDVKTLQKIDTKVGDGAEVTSPNQTVTVDYTGAVAATGVVFDSSQGKQPLTSPLTNLIQGWQEGVVGMKVGGERRLLIPAALAYGAQPPQGSGIPSNAPLVFDITLKEVK